MRLGPSKQPQWPSPPVGDTATIGSRTLLTSELLCESVDLHAGERVLDVPCGSGSAALAAARRFCRAVGVDAPERWIGPAARRRRRLEWPSGRLPEDLPSRRLLDVVLSAGDALLAPASEGTVASCSGPAGRRIGMVSWTPDGTSVSVRGMAGSSGAGRPQGADPVGHLGAAARAVRA